MVLIPAVDPPPRDEEHPGLAVALTLLLVGVFSFLHVYSVQSILPELQRELNASVVQVGNAVGATVLAVAIMAPVMGLVSDALGRRWLMVASVFALALPPMLLTQVDSIDGLLALRFLQGIAVPGVSVVAIAYIGEEFRGGAMVRIMSIYITGGVLGGFLGRFFMGYLTELMNWRAAFGAMGVLNLLGAAAIWRVLPPSRNFVANTHFADELATLGRLLRNPAVQAPCVLGFTVLFAQVALLTFVNLHLAAAPYFFSPAQLANIFAVYLLGIVVTPLAGVMMANLGPRRTLLLSVAASAAGSAFTLLVPAWAIVAALAMASCGVFVTQAGNASFIAQRVTSGRSLASGLYYMSYYAGGFAGAGAGGIAYTLGGWPATVALLVVVQLAGWFVAWRFIR